MNTFEGVVLIGSKDNWKENKHNPTANRTFKKVGKQVLNMVGQVT